MSVREFLRRLFLGRGGRSLTDRARFRCLRCGSEFERQHDTCPECSARFVAELEEE